MKRTILISMSVLLAACASAPTTGVRSPMHTEGTSQVGWQMQVADDNEPLFTVRSAGNVPYSAMLRVAETQAKVKCPYGYRVMTLAGNDEPSESSLRQDFVIGSEIRLKVHCFDKPEE